MSDEDTYRRLIALLDCGGADYRLIDHAPEGATEVVSALRGHPPSEAVKCLVLVVKIDRRTTRYVLAVVPGDDRVDLAAVRTLYGARYAGFADAATAERLARSALGTVLPFSFDPDLELIADVAIGRAPASTPRGWIAHWRCGRPTTCGSRSRGSRRSPSAVEAQWW